jgi:hypothetical protein
MPTARRADGRKTKLTAKDERRFDLIAKGSGSGANVWRKPHM